MKNNIPNEIQLALVNDILYADITDLDCRILLKEVTNTNHKAGNLIAPCDLNNERAEELLSTIVRLSNKYTDEME